MSKPEIPIAHLRALIRKDFGFFARGGLQELHPAVRILWNWHLDLICSYLMDVFEGRTRRLIINIPPRYGKSLLASIAFPAFILAHRPEAEIVCMSYAQDLSEGLAEKTRRLMNSPFYLDTFGPRLVSDRVKLRDLKTSAGGCRLATSVEGTLTGRGGNFLIIDDPIKPQEAESEVRRNSVNEWFDSTVYSRTNDKTKGAIIIIMQRLHEDDLVGHVTERGDWTVLSLPIIAEQDETHTFNTALGPRTVVRKEGEALHPARESLDQIAVTRIDMGTRDFSAQCQQRPAPKDGEIICWDWFRSFDPANPPKFTRVVQSWDTANTEKTQSDFSVGMTFGETSDQHWYLLDVYRGKLKFPELRRKVSELAELHRATNVLIEDCASGVQLAQQLREEGFLKIQAIRPEGSKFERLTACSARIEAGKVWIPSQAHWLETLRHELTFFPRGKYKDQADALSQGLLWLSKMSGPANWLRMLDEADRLLEEQASPHKQFTEPRTIIFTCINPGSNFHVSTGRVVRCSEDGTYRATPGEWQEIKSTRGVTLVYHPDQQT